MADKAGETRGSGEGVSAVGRNLAEMEAAHIRATLESCGGNKKLAAEKLGISRSTLYEKLKECPVPGHGCPGAGHGTEGIASKSQM